uniref:Uncharacterized protein n=1 Tax=Arundo donax TaxID=35708 RepID=A0A0A8ZHC5_ARUDO
MNSDIPAEAPARCSLPPAGQAPAVSSASQHTSPPSRPLARPPRSQFLPSSSILIPNPSTVRGGIHGIGDTAAKAWYWSRKPESDRAGPAGARCDRIGGRRSLRRQPRSNRG